MATRVKSRNYGTEYSDNFDWTDKQREAGARDKGTSGLFQSNDNSPQNSGPASFGNQTMNGAVNGASTGYIQPDMTTFPSTNYETIYRDTVVRKDERGHYLHPFKTIATKPYGRRLMYDDSHPDKMYGSAYSSELADHPGCYSFPTTTGFDPEQPWSKDMSWQENGCTGKWPTDQWKNWTNVALCPPYDGHSDQPQYSQYKVQVP